MKDNDDRVLLGILEAGGCLMAILLVLAVLTSLRTGIPLFDPAIMKLIRTIFIISLVILGVLITAMMAAAMIMGKKPVVPEKSMLIKDGALRYTCKDGNRTYRKTFSLANIDDYLAAYKEMYVVDGLRLYKEDPKKAGSALNLMVEMPDGQKMSLKDLNNIDSDLYDRLAAFLDEIHDKDEIALSFHLGTYVNKESIVHAGDEAIASLNDLKKAISDPQISSQIAYTVDNIEKAKNKVMDSTYNDKLRKFYDNYLGMLVEIVDNYEVLERHQSDTAELAAAKTKLLETFDLINKAIAALESENKSREAEAELEDLDTILKKESGLENKNG